MVETDKDGKALEGGRSGSFGPEDALPDWAEKSISNEDVFEDSQSKDGDTADAPQKPVRKPQA